MEFFAAMLFFGIIPAVIARNKGRSFFPWYIYGVLLCLIALIHSLLMKENKGVVEERALADGTMKKCKFCAELIKAEATVCRFCAKECL